MRNNFFDLGLLKQAFVIPTSIGLALCLILLSGCISISTQNTQFYTLETALANPPVPPNKAAIYIDLLPIKMPEYLKRPQLVTHGKDSTQVNILEHSRWASPFNNELQDALSALIAQQTNAIMTLPGNRASGSPTYRLAINLQQLNAYPNDHITASFSWSLASIGQPGSAESNNISCQFSADESLNPGTEGVVKGTQVIVQKLALQISDAINKLNEHALPTCKGSLS